MKGNLPYNMVLNPCSLSDDMYVYGKFDGVTDKYADCGSGTIPVFQVTYYDPPIMLIDLESFTPFFNILFFLFPLFVIALLYLVAAFIINTAGRMKK